MLPARIYKPMKLPALLVILGMLVFGFFCTGIFHQASMYSIQVMVLPAASMSAQGNLPCCNISTSNDVDSWSKALTAVAPNVRDGLILFALGLVLSFTWFLSQYYGLNRPALRLHLYLKQNPSFAMFNHVRLAFAQGILNPKIY